MSDFTPQYRFMKSLFIPDNREFTILYGISRDQGVECDIRMAASEAVDAVLALSQGGPRPRQRVVDYGMGTLQIYAIAARVRA